MIKDNAYWLGFFCVFGIFIWLRDLSWIPYSQDTLPILVSFPLFYYLGKPWIFTKDSPYFFPSKLYVPATFFLLGIILNVSFFLVISWVILLLKWLKVNVKSPSLPYIKRLQILLILGFPWITSDLPSLGWWFRLSAAKTTALLFTIFGNDVVQDGTNLLINHVPISVEAACSGMNTLQAMLIAGSALALIKLGTTPYYWWNITLLIVIAWLANTLRVLITCLIALFISIDFAVGTFHIFSGWLILCSMFFICWITFSIQENYANKKSLNDK